MCWATHSGPSINYSISPGPPEYPSLKTSFFHQTSECTQGFHILQGPLQSSFFPMGPFWFFFHQRLLQSTQLPTLTHVPLPHLACMRSLFLLASYLSCFLRPPPKGQGPQGGAGSSCSVSLHQSHHFWVPTTAICSSFQTYIASSDLSPDLQSVRFQLPPGILSSPYHFTPGHLRLNLRSALSL